MKFITEHYLSLLVVLMCVSGSFSRQRYYRSCRIPAGPVYSRSNYETSERPTLSAGSKVRPGGHIIVTCNADRYGDIIVKRYVSLCRGGRWRPRLPKCLEYKRCEAPATIPGTSVSEHLSDGISFPHEYPVIYTCEGDYQLVGNDERTCRDGIWSAPEFECRERAETLCQPPQLDHVMYEPTLEGYTANQTVVLTGCQGREMILEGDSEVTCLETGTWSGSATCRTKKWCRPTVIKHGVLIEKVEGIKVICRRRFMYDKSVHLSLRCEDGQWVGSQPTCVPASCTLPAPKMPTSIFVDITTQQVVTGMTVTHDTKIRQFCKAGHESQAMDNRCRYGRWKRRFRNCPKTVATRFLKSRTITPKRCVIPQKVFAIQEVNNETIEATESVVHGEIVQMMCIGDNGVMEPDDSNTLLEVHCIDGVWVPQLSVCSQSTGSSIGLHNTVQEAPTSKTQETTDKTKSSFDNTKTTLDPSIGPDDTVQGGQTSKTQETTENSESSFDNANTTLDCASGEGEFILHTDSGRVWRRIVTRRQFVHGVPTTVECQRRCLQLDRFFCTTIEVRSVKNKAGFVNCNLFYIDSKLRDESVYEDPNYNIYQRECKAPFL